MPRRSKWVHLVAGVVVGVTVGVFLKLCLRPSSRTNIERCPYAAKTYTTPDPLALIDLKPDETITNSNRTLLFVGVMTAEQYLETRARAVYETWGQELPGRIAFFSSEVSRARNLPLVPLKNVDDSYPPQKKSFMMLLFMYENYGDKFEWFMRADDDVYVRGDKLGEFLRSVDSRKPQFIGQAGRGTGAERGALALDYNENFCMGGPGVILSRETLRRVAPHVKYCLRHLYTTHEDVELGRCVAKFAGVSCTWSYDGVGSSAPCVLASICYCAHLDAAKRLVSIGKFPPMDNSPKNRPPVPGGSAIPPGQGSGRGYDGAGGAKNPRQRPGYRPQRLDLVTYNAKTLRLDEKLEELEEEISRLRWSIMGLSEVRREGQDTIILKSGNLLFYREGHLKSQGGVGFLVHKSLVNNVVEIESVSSRVAYLILRISERYSMKVIQVYAPHSGYSDDEVEAMYEYISRTMHGSPKTHFTVVMGDFNAKLGKRSGDELRVGPFGFTNDVSWKFPEKNMVLYVHHGSRAF